MKHSFPLPASSDDELFEQLVKISPITKEAMLSFEEDLKEMYCSLATPGWEEYASIPSSNGNGGGLI